MSFDFFMRLPSNRREDLWWWLRLRLRWPYWRQTRLILPLWTWWMLRQAECEMCDGTGCPCMRARDWQSMELGCECGCGECGRTA